MSRLLFVSVLLALATTGCTLIDPPSDLAAFDANGTPITTAVVGQTVTFTCSGTDPFAIHLYMWDFGDGTVTEWDEIEIEHTYTEPGEYAVSAKERCPMIFGDTCLMKTDWSLALTLTVKAPDVVASDSAGGSTVATLGKASSPE